MKNNNKNTILIISNSFDLHVDIMTQRLADMGENVFRLNLDQFPRDYRISFQVQSLSSPDYQLHYLPDNRSITNASVKSVWVRKKAPFSFLSDDMGEQEQLYAQSECEHLLFGFLTSLDCYWMNHPKAMRGAQWKVEQLARASRFGFNVPATLLSNQPEEVREFYQKQNQNIIMKSIAESSVQLDSIKPEDIVTTGISTTVITEEHLAMLDAVREFPCQFQAYVEKQYELRITVVGKQLFVAKIDSQSDERTRIDFRDFSVDIAYQAWQLPDEIASRCLEFVHSYGLQYGAIDLIFTPDNQYVFLENNPGGQFLFIEQLVPELQIMESVANCLANAKGRY